MSQEPCLCFITANLGIITGILGDSTKALTIISQKKIKNYKLWNTSHIKNDKNNIMDWPSDSLIPTMESLFKVVNEIDQYLLNPMNTAIIICDGTILRAILLTTAEMIFSGLFPLSDSALSSVYHQLKKHRDHVPSLIPSQCRYLKYLTKAMTKQSLPRQELELYRIIMNTMPNIENKSCDPSLYLKTGNGIIQKFILTKQDNIFNTGENLCFAFQPIECLRIAGGDFTMELRHKDDQNLFTFSFHSGFLDDQYHIRIYKHEIDGAYSDDKFDDNFFLDLFFLVPNEDTIDVNINKETQWSWEPIVINRLNNLTTSLMLDTTRVHQKSHVKRANTTNPRASPLAKIKEGASEAFKKFSITAHQVSSGFTTLRGRVSSMWVGTKRNKPFGTNLSDVIRFEKEDGSDSGIPFVVQECIHFITHNGMKTLGLFRLSGRKEKVDNFKNAFENMDYDEISRLLSDEKKVVIPALSTLLKHFFYELPEPLFTFEVYDKFLELSKEIDRNPDATNDIVVTGLINLIEKLPEIHKIILEWMVRFLYEIQKHFEDNKMDARNLAIVFAPSLLRPKSITFTVMTDIPTLTNGLELLIINCNKIFGEKVFNPPESIRFSKENLTTRNRGLSSIFTPRSNNKKKASNSTISPELSAQFTDIEAEMSSSIDKQPLIIDNYTEDKDKKKQNIKEQDQNKNEKNEKNNTMVLHQDKKDDLPSQSLLNLDSSKNSTMVLHDKGDDDLPDHIASGFDQNQGEIKKAQKREEARKKLGNYTRKLLAQQSPQPKNLKE